jgi:hypothetical protein
MLRWASGKTGRIPFDALVHHIARRYGQTPAAVREWPADDFLKAAAYDPFLTPRTTGRGA